MSNLDIKLGSKSWVNQHRTLKVSNGRVKIFKSKTGIPSPWPPSS